MTTIAPDQDVYCRDFEPDYLERGILRVTTLYALLFISAYASFCSLFEYS